MNSFEHTARERWQEEGYNQALGDSCVKHNSQITYETVDGKWWLFENGEKIRPLTDDEAAQVIWGTINCPFCGERDFDLMGLKYHLENYCETYRSTKDIDKKV